MNSVYPQNLFNTVQNIGSDLKPDHHTLQRSSLVDYRELSLYSIVDSGTQ